MFELGTDGPSTIVVGVDGSTTSMRAGAYAAGLARRQRSRLVVVHVLTLGGLATLVPAGMAAIRQANQEIAEELRRQVADAAEARGVDGDVRGGTGRPVPGTGAHRGPGTGGRHRGGRVEQAHRTGWRGRWRSDWYARDAGR